MNKKGRPGWAEKRLIISLSKTEVDLLEKYCKKYNKKQAEIIRSLLRASEYDTNIEWRLTK